MRIIDFSLTEIHHRMIAHVSSDLLVAETRFVGDTVMQILKLFAFFYVLSTVNSYLLERQLVVAESLKIICEVLRHTRETFIIKSVKEENSEAGNEWIQEIALKLRNNAIQIEDADHVSELKRRRRKYAIILIDCFESFEKFHGKMTKVKFNHNGFYIIVLMQNLSRVIIERIFASFWKISISNVVVLMQNVFDDLSLLTFLPFGGGTCGNVRAVKINEFYRKTSQWESEKFFPKKLGNLHKCQLKVGTYESAPGLILKNHSDGVQVHGFEGDLFNHIAEKLNFTMQITAVNYSGGYINENGTATGLLEKVMLKEFDLVMSLLSSSHLRYIYLTPTVSYYVDKMIVIIPSDRMLDSFLKLFFVFNSTLWLTLITIFTAAVVLFQFVKFACPSFHQRTLKEISVPYLSLLVAFVGGSERRTPRKHFPRIIMASFLVFCLVVRSIYQGALFNILKKDVLVNKIKTLDDINRFQYTFYVLPSIEVKIKEINIFQR